MEILNGIPPPRDGKWLRRMRRIHGMRQQDVANLIRPKSINPGRVSEIETGKGEGRYDWFQQWEDYFRKPH